MAYVNTNTRAVNGGIAERLNAVVKSLKDGMNRRRVYNQTLRELYALTDRELADLGIHRSNIAQIAREAAYGK